MRILWICGLPREVEEHLAGQGELGAHAAWSWIVGHLPPPHGVDLHIACPITRGKWCDRTISYRGATFHLLRWLPGRARTLFLADPLIYRRLVRRLNPDIIHGWGTEDSHANAAMVLAPMTHVVQVQGLITAYLPYLSNSVLVRYIAWRERRTLATARNVFVESEYSRSIVRPLCGRNTVIHVVDHPLRAPFLTEPLDRPAGQKVVYIGTLDQRKGYLDAVEAFSRVAAAPWTMAMLGNGPTDRVNKLRDLIEAKHLGDRIRHVAVASVDRLIDELRNAAVFLLPSQMDTGPTALKEAMSMGLWPICYDNCGPKEYITRYRYGTLVPTGNVQELSVCLGLAFETKPWGNEFHRNKVSRFVRSDLAPTTIWKRLINSYEGVLSNS